MAELLLELFSEEVPARMQRDAERSLALLLTELFHDHGLEFSGVQPYSTPRRLTAVATGLPTQTAAQSVERRGPKVGAPASAIEGFLAGLGTAKYRLEERDEKKGKVFVAIWESEGRATSSLVAAALPNRLNRFPWPKSMCWGSGDTRWVRPLQSILCVFNNEVLNFSFAGIASGNTTRGHRFLAPKPFAVQNFDEYVTRLRQSYVVLSRDERFNIVSRGIAELLQIEDLQRAFPPSLVDEVVGLVEWPVPLAGRIDDEFMDLPEEALGLTMRTNQKYLTLRTQDGAFAPRFVVVANMAASDGGAAIVAGNERVLRARLWDARFFWDQDRKATLESRLPAMERMVFHAELGTQGQRVERLVALAGALVPYLPSADRAMSERAALLAKADLLTGMVGEFPELQGIMGGHYARVQGESAAVAAAIRDHYAPKGPDDTCPSAPDSVVVALADKLDTLTGFFAAGIRPTGSKDPFALRRAGLGIIRLILDNRLRLGLRQAFAAALAGYGERFQDVAAEGLGQELTAFLADRLKGHLRDRGVRHDVVAAAFAVGAEDDLVRLIVRAEALQAFLDSEDGRNLVTAYRRASSIVGIEEKKDGRRYAGHPVVGALVDPAEEDLYAALESAQGVIDAALEAEDYAGAMAALAGLRAPVDRFFDAVMVNVSEPDLRVNRLLLLARIRASLQRVADFALIEDAGRPES